MSIDRLRGRKGRGPAWGLEQVGVKGVKEEQEARAEREDDKKGKATNLSGARERGTEVSCLARQLAKAAG